MRPQIPPLYSAAYRLVGNRADAEDLVQEVLVKLFPRTRPCSCPVAHAPGFRSSALQDLNTCRRLGELRFPRERYTRGCCQRPPGEHHDQSS
jgi:Sigma-70 region 2